MVADLLLLALPKKIIDSEKSLPILESKCFPPFLLEAFYLCSLHQRRDLLLSISFCGNGSWTQFLVLIQEPSSSPFSKLPEVLCFHILQLYPWSIFDEFFLWLEKKSSQCVFLWMYENSIVTPPFVTKVTLP